MLLKAKKLLAFSPNLRKNINDKTVQDAVSSRNLFPAFIRIIFSEEFSNQ
jgi:hypothetical protein